MNGRAGGPVAWGGTALAFTLAQARYWASVYPRVRAELAIWQARAEAIGDPVLRTLAADKLCAERANTEAIATLCTLAPPAHRGTTVVAAVALQVMYDYLDAVTEQPVADPFRDGRQLFRTFAVAFTPGEGPVDYYRFHPRRDDGGYLDALVERARSSIAALPGIATVLPTARSVSARFAEAQIRSHAVRCYGSGQLKTWAEGQSRAAGLTWWEWAGGAAASVLAVHALVAAAATGTTTRAGARQIDHVYLLGSALTTMLDSLIDDERDLELGAHRYTAYYADAEHAAARISAIAQRAVLAAQRLPSPAHHTITIAGIAAFYLSATDSSAESIGLVARRVTDQLRPTITPVLAVLRLWRWVLGERRIRVPS